MFPMYPADFMGQLLEVFAVLIQGFGLSQFLFHKETYFTQL